LVSIDALWWISQDKDPCLERAHRKEDWMTHYLSFEFISENETTLAFSKKTQRREAGGWVLSSGRLNWLKEIYLHIQQLFQKDLWV
jgi:hypothetical protein